MITQNEVSFWRDFQPEEAAINNDVIQAALGLVSNLLILCLFYPLGSSHPATSLACSWSPGVVIFWI